MEKLVLFSTSCLFFFFFLVILNIPLMGPSAEVERGTEVLQKLSYEYMSGKGYCAKKPFCYKGSKGNWLKVNIRSTYKLTWMMVPSVSTLSSLPLGKRFFTVWSGKVISLRPSGKCFSEAGIKINVEYELVHMSKVHKTSMRKEVPFLHLPRGLLLLSTVVLKLLYFILLLTVKWISDFCSTNNFLWWDRKANLLPTVHFKIATLENCMMQ